MLYSPVMPAPATPPDDSPPRSRLRSRLVASGLSIVAILTLLTLGFAWSALSKPSWWDTATPTTATPGTSTPGPSTRWGVGLALENGITAALHAPRAPGERWTVALKQSDLNAWFDERLALWLRNRDIELPDGWSAPRARFDGTRLSIVSRLDQAGRAPRFIGVSMELSVPAGNAPSASADSPGASPPAFRIVAPRLLVGRLAIPVAAAPGFADWLAGLFASAGLDAAQATSLTQGLLGARDLPAHIALQDGRSLHLLGIAPGGTPDQPAMLITCQTIPAAQAP